VVRASSGPRRSVAFVAVALLHAGLVVVLVIALSNHNGASRVPDPGMALIFLALPPQAPALRTDLRKQSFAPAPSTAITLPELTPPAERAPVDWDAAARGAAAAASVAPGARPLGHNPAADAPPVPASPAAVVHEAGEQYRDPADGTTIVYVSDHCFVASSPPPPGTPDVIARAVATRTVCKGDPGWSRPDLFKDLPAYERLHPKEPGNP
jgi:hypothetical protein